MPQRQINPERKAAYYFGMTQTVIGFLTFGSIFVSFAQHFGDFTNFNEQTRSMIMRGVIGMGLVILGQVIASIGSHGAAGSGVILDPEQARKDVEPWSRMTGGVVRDALDEAGISLGQKPESDKLPFDEQLRRLHKLYEDGLISEAEYNAKRKEILDGV